MKTKQSIYAALLVLACCLVTLVFCRQEREPKSQEQAQALQVALEWNRCLLRLEGRTDGYRPPVSARMYAYMGICAWETSLPGLNHAHSFLARHSAIKTPEWSNNGAFLLPVALNAAYAKMTAYFFSLTCPQNQMEYEDLNRKNLLTFEKIYPKEDIERSKVYGEAIAEIVFSWSAGDNIGHQAFLYNFDRNFKPLEGAGYWRPNSTNAMPALLPYWGSARTFIVDTISFPAKPPIPFSEEIGSPFFSQAMEVYALSQPVSSENHWIAEFWSDDFPGVTFSAASRWISICNQAIEKDQLDLAKSLETWLKVGLALNDAAVKVWQTKYRYQLERPASYIQRNINPLWAPLHDTPNFPSYPSGHAAFGAAASTVLSTTFGNDFHLTDNSHKGRKEFQGDPRAFPSFAVMARENAFSRLPLGVHYRMDCEEGFRLGKLIGEKISQLHFLDDVRN